MYNTRKTINILTLALMTSLLAACGQGIGSMSLKPVHTDDSNGLSLTLSKKEVGQTIQELQSDVQSRQNYSGRLSDQ